RRRMLTGGATLGVAAVVVGGSLALLGSPLTTGTPIQPGGSLSPTPSSEPSTGPTPPTTPSATSTAPATTAARESCTAADVTLSLGPADGAAGTAYYPVMIKAKPGVTCWTGGFASVQVTRPKGDPVGPAAENPPAADGRALVVEGAQVASFTVGIAESGNFDPAVCLPVVAVALQVMLPASSDPIAVPVPDGVTVCSGNVSAFGNQLTVGPIVAGPDGQ
ncbi:MAG: DUF4232 domain-containing protein, partial [Candidatus Nanopelagicales bacterium]